MTNDGNDGLNRCSWCLGGELFRRYHDEEWGVPVHEDNRHFEFLVLEGAQAGLSWATVLKKREAYRQAYDGFDPGKVAEYDDEKIEGKSDLSNVSGSEQDGQTVLEFTVPLDSGDPKDKPLSVEGDTIVMLAYGRSDSIVLKHRFRAILKVNLSSGEHSVLKIK